MLEKYNSHEWKMGIVLVLFFYSIFAMVAPLAARASHYILFFAIGIGGAMAALFPAVILVLEEEERRRRPSDGCQWPANFRLARRWLFGVLVVNFFQVSIGEIFGLWQWCPVFTTGQIAMFCLGMACLWLVIAVALLDIRWVNHSDRTRPDISGYPSY